MSEHIFNKDFENKLLTLKELSEITGYSRDWIRLQVCRSDFAAYRSEYPRQKGGCKLIYNQTTVNLMNKLKNRRTANAYVYFY